MTAVDIEYKSNHGGPSCEWRWTLCSALFCPACGVKDVWENDSEDYYLGTMFLCLGCGAGGHGWYSTPGDGDTESFKKLRAALGRA